MAARKSLKGVKNRKPRSHSGAKKTPKTSVRLRTKAPKKVEGATGSRKKGTGKKAPSTRVKGVASVTVNGKTTHHRF